MALNGNHSRCDEWYTASATFGRMKCDRKTFFNLTSITQYLVQLGNKTTVDAVAQGTVNLRLLVIRQERGRYLENIYLVQSLQYLLLPVSPLIKMDQTIYSVLMVRKP